MWQDLKKKVDLELLLSELKIFHLGKRPPNRSAVDLRMILEEGKHCITGVLELGGCVVFG